MRVYIIAFKSKTLLTEEPIEEMIQYDLKDGKEFNLDDVKRYIMEKFEASHKIIFTNLWELKF